jgi:tetratricopeptide (TPR) repeat protein
MPVVIVDIGSAPKAAPPPPPVPEDQRNRKAERAAAASAAANDAACLSRAELKDWMVDKRLTSCDLALAQAEPAGSYWDRRALLLQQRAYMAINKGDGVHALEALDESDAIGKAQIVKDGTDPLFDMSIGIGNSMLRAWILHARGQNAQAYDLLAKAKALRPDAPSLVASVDQMETQIEFDIPKYIARLEKRIRIDPDVMKSLIFLHLAMGEFDKAAIVGDQISLAEPKSRGGWTMSNAQTPFEMAERAAEFETTKAYIAARRGKAEARDGYMAKARQIIVDYVGVDPTVNPPKGTTPKKRDIEAYAARKVEAEKLTLEADEWLDAINFRDKIGDGDVLALVNHFGKFKNKPELLPALLESLNGYAAKGKNDAIIATQFRDQLLRQSLYLDGGEYLAIMGDRLPRGEHLDQIGKLGSNSLDWLWGGSAGFTQTKEVADGGADIRTIRYETTTGTGAIAEEMLMLAIVHYAEADKKDAFVFLTNRTVARHITTSNCFYYSCSAGVTSDAGFVSESRVQLFNAATPPPELPAGSVRIITTADVKAALMPRYQAYGDRKAVIEAEKKAARK